MGERPLDCCRANLCQSAAPTAPVLSRRHSRSDLVTARTCVPVARLSSQPHTREGGDCGANRHDGFSALPRSCWSTGRPGPGGAGRAEAWLGPEALGCGQGGKEPQTTAACRTGALSTSVGTHVSTGRLTCDGSAQDPRHVALPAGTLHGGGARVQS